MAVWVGVLLVFLVLVELIRLNGLLLGSLKRVPRIEAQGSAAEAAGDLPKVSVIIPARNEENNIERSVRAVLASDYPSLELIVVDDRSHDRTGEILDRLDAQDARLRVLTISSLPEGWTGKTHALYRATQQASGEIFLFTDADTALFSDTLTRTVSFVRANGLDMVSVLPQFTDRGFPEDVVYPHLAFGFSYFYPLAEVNDPSSSAALACGCFIMISRRMYESVGTWTRCRLEITEDVALSKAVKASGGKLNVLRGGDLLQVQPFGSTAAVCRFWKRTLYGGLEKRTRNVLRLTLNYVTLTVVFFLFFISGASIVLGYGSVSVGTLFVVSFMAVLAVVVPLCRIVRQEHGHWLYGLLAPVGLVISAWVTVSTVLAIAADKGIQWRGSVYK